MKRKTERRSHSTQINWSWTSSWERTWWLLCSMRRLSYSILSLWSWSNRWIHSPIQQDFARCLKQKNLFPRLFVYLDKKKEPLKCWITVSLNILTKFILVVDKSIDLVIPAHDTEIGAMAVNPDGTLIASASARGHIIKIYSTDGGEVV